jgi:hypothetical protein
MDVGDSVRYTVDHWRWLESAGKAAKSTLGSDGARRTWTGVVVGKEADGRVLKVRWTYGAAFSRSKDRRSLMSHFSENLEVAT